MSPASISCQEMALRGLGRASPDLKTPSDRAFARVSSYPTFKPSKRARSNVTSLHSGLLCLGRDFASPSLEFLFPGTPFGPVPKFEVVSNGGERHFLLQSCFFQLLVRNHSPALLVPFEPGREGEAQLIEIQPGLVRDHLTHTILGQAFVSLFRPEPEFSVNSSDHIEGLTIGGRVHCTPDFGWNQYPIFVIDGDFVGAKKEFHWVYLGFSGRMCYYVGEFTILFHRFKYNRSKLSDFSRMLDELVENKVFFGDGPKRGCGWGVENPVDKLSREYCARKTSDFRLK
jgi:hypothetical protein